MAPPLTRRETLLAGGTALATLAGCVSSSPSESEENATTTSPPATTTESAASVTVNAVKVTPTIVTFNSPDSTHTMGEKDEQFALIRVSAEEANAPARDDFSIGVGDSNYASQPMDYGERYSRMSGYRTFYGEESSGYLLFVLPKPISSEEASLQWPSGEYAFEADTVAALSQPPTDFAVREFSTPETVKSGTEVTLTLTVENTGSADGTFVGALNRIGPQVAYTPEKWVEVSIPAGESRTWTYSYRPTTGDGGEGSMTYRMPWRNGSEETTTTLESDDTE
ncbi:hypothetical protein [Haladaptatus sp. DJG-WS-42]|uniref:hypothetical protein n=1 Tax=Haladaptatus sp. DJG-WS-42 TaxID=3120516 RepID=UPI0030CF593A